MSVIPEPPRVTDRDFRRGNRRRRKSRRRARRIVKRSLIGLAIAAPVVALLGLLAISPAASAKDHLQQGRDDLVRAQTALLGGDPAAAVQRFDDAEREFQAAKSDGNNPLLWLPSLLPLMGRTPDAVRTLADVGLRISGAGRQVAQAIAALPGGFDALTPHSGTIPVGALTSLEPAVAAAREQFEVAEQEASGVATTMVPGVVAQAGDLVRAKLEQALPIVRATDGIIRALPEFAGMDSPRHYFLAPQNPTELRGTGGLISAYSILTIDQGAISVAPFKDIRMLPNTNGLPWPSPELEAIYSPFDSANFWRGTNATPDAPTAATLIEQLWDKTQQQPIDGVILVDVQTLSYMLDAVGEVNVPGVPYPLNKNNVVKFVANDAYRLIKSDTARKSFVGVVGQAIFSKFLKEAHGDRALRALVAASANGHIVLNVSDPQTEAALRLAGITGQLGPPNGGDFFSTVVNNTGENKLDYYIQRDERFDVSLLPDGRAQVHATVTLTNTAPANAQPSYVFGPPQGKDLKALHLRPGDAFQDTAFYCGSGCDVQKIIRDGAPLPIATNVESGLTRVSTAMRIDRQTSTVIELNYELPDAWSGSNAIGTYLLHLQSQPTIAPTTAEVVIHVPSGTSISYAGAPLKVSGSQASWSGQLSDLSGFEVRFNRGFLGRVLSDVNDFLSKPIVHL